MSAISWRQLPDFPSLLCTTIRKVLQDYNYYPCIISIYNLECDGEEVWEESSADELQQDDLPSLPDFESDTSQTQSAKALILWMLGFLITLQAKYYIPNAAVDVLLKFLYIFISVLSRFSPFLKQICKQFPKSLHSLYKIIQYEDSFQKYVICQKCSHLYKRDECIETVGSQKKSKSCVHIKYPLHPHASRRLPCQALLMKSVQYISGHKILYPYKIYCYKNIQSTLQEFLLCPQFYLRCQQWRTRPTNCLLSEVYDGQVWKQFQCIQGVPFLAAQFTFAFALNVDWFQPFTHTVYSVGVIYLTILNLPRTFRYKLENVIVVGIIPGPSEPAHDINSYLQPLVNELLSLWTGISLRVSIPSGVVEKNIKCALLCIACDLPAGRKSCGFLSHNARLGCSRCLKEFTGVVGNQNFSGFDRSKWIARTDIQHRRDVERVKACRTKSEKAAMESSLGCRYSVFLDLPYFNASRFLVIDPMHNYFVFRNWKGND